MAKNIEIRNSTAEFLIFMLEGKEDGIQVMYKNETIWATQKAMAQLFDVGVPAISKHLKNIFESGELVENSVISKMETTASDGKNYNTTYYNLDAIISVGYVSISKSLNSFPMSFAAPFYPFLFSVLFHFCKVIICQTFLCKQRMKH